MLSGYLPALRRIFCTSIMVTFNPIPMEKNYSEKLQRIMNGAKFKHPYKNSNSNQYTYKVFFEGSGYVVKRQLFGEFEFDSFVDAARTDGIELVTTTGSIGRSAFITFDVENDFVLID